MDSYLLNFSRKLLKIIPGERTSTTQKSLTSLCTWQMHAGARAKGRLGVVSVPLWANLL